MKKGQLIGIAIAGACAIGAFVLAKNIVSKPKEIRVETQSHTTEVLVARSNISLGQITTDQSFRWQAWPDDGVPPGAVSRQSGADAGGALRQFVGSVARTPILMGEPITRAKLANPKDGGVLAAILPEGKRAISVGIRDEFLAAGKLILPNDRVDVILVRRQRGRGGQEEQVSETVFRDIRVLAIGQRIEVKDGQKSADGNTATLELDTDQAEEMVLARSRGEITLALRSIADINKKDADVPAKRDNKASNSVKVLRYGYKSRAYGVN
ncbi:MAG: Flp pilus assembly protein CpaB [Proteobacteria bacterium]|nr:Flp pilus assembly protein CpaB [Pseudomonadota bacterium]